MTEQDGEDQAFVDAISEWPDIDDGPTLAGFLLARIAEDEDAARNALGGPIYGIEATGWDEMIYLAEGEGCYGEGTFLVRRFDPARVLAECEAKRRIVGLWDLRMSEPDPELGFEPAPLGGQGAEVYYDAIRLLALPYADHPAYRPEWRT